MIYIVPTEHRPPGLFRVAALALFCVLFIILFVGPGTAHAQIGKDSVTALLKNRFGFSDGDIFAIDHHEIVTKEIETENSFEVAVCGVMRVRLPLASAIKSYAEKDAYKKNPDIVANGRFAAPPRIEDMKGLTLEEDDYKALKDCRKGDCKLKLPGETMLRFRKEIDWNSDGGPADALLQVKTNFVKYVAAYRAKGDSALMNYDDIEYPQTRVEEYRDLLAKSPGLSDWGKDLYRSLQGNAPFPDSNATISGHIFWQKEILDGAKPTTTIEQIMIHAPSADGRYALIGSKQLYADHFCEASLTITALVSIPGDTAGLYVICLSRANYDDLRKTGIFSFHGRIHDAIVKQFKHELVWTRERILAAAPAAKKDK